MKYTSNLTDFYHTCKKDVRSLLYKYSKRFAWSNYDKEELEQGFYFIVLKRGVLENFDSTVSNIDKVFTSYICEIIKNYCKEEKRRLLKVREQSKKHLTEIECDTGKKVDIFEAAQYSWLPGSRTSNIRLTTEGGHQALTECGGESFEAMVDSFCAALAADDTISDKERTEIEMIVRNTSAGVSASDVSKSMGCRPSKITLIRKKGLSRFEAYRKRGHV